MNRFAKKVLIITANPVDTVQIQIQDEVRKIRDALERSIYKHQIDVYLEWGVRIGDIRRAMLKYRPNLVHFSGHGIENKGIALEDEGGKAKIVSGESLASLFKLFPEVECVLLNACYSETQAKAIAQHVSCVIGVKQAIGDEIAIKFALGFYDAIGAGESIEFAYHMGRNSIEMEGFTVDLAPVLLKGSDNKVNNFGSKNDPKLLSSRPPVPPLLPYLADRDQQEFELSKIIQQLKAIANPLPLICIIHGNELECHDQFLERLKHINLPKLFALATEQTSVKEYYINWPTRYGSIDDLHRMLTQSLAERTLDCAKADNKAINNFFKLYPGPILIHTHLLTDDWRSGNRDIVREFLSFWQKWPELGKNQRLIICLCVKYQIKQSLGLLKRLYTQLLNRKITEQLVKSNFSEFDRLSIAVLPKLEGITRRDVESWVLNSKNLHLYRGSDLLVHIRIMFEEWESQTSLIEMPMENFAKKINHLLLTIDVREEKFG